MKCEKCGKGPADGVSVYRVNEKGVKGIWRCVNHLEPEKHPAPDTETVKLVNILEEWNK
jgi:uncharacterized protein YwgA